MQIREEQLDAIADAMLQKFEGQMAVHLRSRFTEKLVKTSDADLQDMIHTGVETADSYQVKAKYDIRRFLEYTVEYGAQFHTRPWAERILTDRSLTGNKKMNRLDDYSTFELRS